MTKTDDGGPAFPNSIGGKYIERGADGIVRRIGSDGMSLRDWFAGQALTLSRFENDAVGESDYPLTSGDHAKLIAEAAYEVADAMLKERSKEALK